MSHDQNSCDIYKRFNWHKQASRTLELQPHHTMRPLSADKLNIVISRLHSGQTTCQISSSTGFSIDTISKIHSEHLSDLPKSSGGYSVRLSPANVCHTVHFITSGKAGCKQCKILTHGPYGHVIKYLSLLIEKAVYLLAMYVHVVQLPVGPLP